MNDDNINMDNLLEKLYPYSLAFLPFYLPVWCVWSSAAWIIGKIVDRVVDYRISRLLEQRAKIREQEAMIHASCQYGYRSAPPMTYENIEDVLGPLH